MKNIISFDSLNLQVNNNTVIIDFNDNNIEVLQYLPIEEKNDIIQLALQNADENGLYNDLKVDMFFHLYIVYLYTNLEFTTEEKADFANTYNALKSNGIIDAIINSIPQNEYEYLRAMLKDTLARKTKYRSTLAAVLNGFIENLPINANSAKEIIENFNPEQFQAVLNFAQAANGNRPIN